jgi:hypothetical protein
MIIYPFQPDAGTGLGYVTGADAAITNLQKGCRSVLVTNRHATEPVYVRIAESGAATAADACVPALSQKVFTKDADAVIGRIFSAAAGSAHVICGNGN